MAARPFPETGMAASASFLPRPAIQQTAHLQTLLELGFGIPIVVVWISRYPSPMLWNIIDRRTRPYRWREVNAIVEATKHDNSCRVSDQAPECDPATTVDYEALEAVSVYEAVKWAEGQRCPVTLYLYDLGSGFGDEEHFTIVEVRFEDKADAGH
jgi:hypothetical protein